MNPDEAGYEGREARGTGVSRGQEFIDWLEASCAASGVPSTISDPAALTAVTALLGCPHHSHRPARDGRTDTISNHPYKVAS